jgi:hypothetical protein
MAGLLDVSAKPKTHCSLLARRPLLYFGFDGTVPTKDV